MTESGLNLQSLDKEAFYWVWKKREKTQWKVFTARCLMNNFTLTLKHEFINTSFFSHVEYLQKNCEYSYRKLFFNVLRKWMCSNISNVFIIFKSFHEFPFYIESTNFHSLFLVSVFFLHCFVVKFIIRIALVCDKRNTNWNNILCYIFLPDSLKLL